MSKRTWTVSSPEAPPPSRRVLAGVFSPRGVLDPGQISGLLTRATEGSPDRLLAGVNFAAASVGGSMHRDGGLVCVLQGQLTNGASLAARLDRGPRTGPAALVAKAYSRRGESALEELRGEFAVVLWDSDSMKGLIARDQLGGRTVFTHASGERLTFASDLKWLLRLLPQRPGVDELGLLQWMALGGATQGRTLYEGIHRLEPGALIRLGRDGWSTRTYWRPRPSRPSAVSRDEAAAELRTRISAAISSRIDGGSVGVALSGGMDSSTVAALARDGARHAELVAYSMTFPAHPDLDETRLIDAVARQLGIESVQMQVRGGSMVGRGLEFLATWELPTPIPNTVFMTELQRCASERGTTVMLDGEGGDELFEADPFLPASLLRAGRWLAAWQLCRQVPGFGDDPAIRQVWRAFVQLGIRGAAPAGLRRLRRAMRKVDGLAPEWFLPGCARNFRETHDQLAWRRAGGPLWWTHLADVLTAGRERAWAFDYLRQTAGLSELDDRHPLLDLGLVELVLELPPEYAYDRHLSRPLIRDAMRGLVPDGVRLRSGKTFFTPLIYDSLFRDDLPLVRELLEAPGGELRAFVDPSTVSSLLDAAGSGADTGAFAIGAFRLVMAECWLRAQADRDFPQRLIETARFCPLEVEFTAPAGGVGAARGRARSTDLFTT